MDWIRHLLGIQVELRDFIGLAAVFVSVIAFLGKLRSDSRIVRFRETLGYIEKREEKARESWKMAGDTSRTKADRDEAARVLVGQMEMVSYLMAEKVFEPELVYQYWWEYFDEPLRDPTINAWLQAHRKEDPALFQYYQRRCELWADRIDKEQGRQARPLLKRWATAFSF